MSRSLQVETTSIQDDLSDDHRRLNHLFDDLVGAVWRGESRAARVRDEFERALVHHIRWEEDHLFPAVLGDVTKDLRRHVESLRIDHERLQELLRLVGAELAARRYDGAKPLLEELTYHLAGHNDDEELGIYREADRHLETGDRMDLIRRFHEGEGGP